MSKTVRSPRLPRVPERRLHLSRLAPNHADEPVPHSRIAAKVSTWRIVRDFAARNEPGSTPAAWAGSVS